jgi:hypothetical protein
MPKQARGRIKNALLNHTQQCIFCFPQMKNESFWAFYPSNHRLKNTFIFTINQQNPFNCINNVFSFGYFFSQ